MAEFWKYHGTGNDFILLDNRRETFPKEDNAFWESLCHRHFGIGADGVIFLEGTKDADIKMTYLNSDGNEVAMCGNGARCLINFARQQLDIPLNEYFSLLTRDAIYNCKLNKDQPSILFPRPETMVLDVSDFLPEANSFFVINGVPHVIFHVDSIKEEWLTGLAPKVRGDARFPEGTNVNFVRISGDELIVRTFERGVEAETLSCGTGVVASVHALIENGLLDDSFYKVSTPGGDLMVSKDDEGLWLEGPAEYVFKGSFRLDLAQTQQQD